MQPALDSYLIESACSGDADAIERVLLQYQPSLQRFARRYCATPEDAEDAVQETLWMVYRQIGTLRAASAFVSWVFTIVRNACYHLLKKGRDDTLPEDIPDETGEPDVELQRDLAAAIARLPLAYRQVLILRDVEGRTTPETAAALDLTAETVKSRLHRARAVLRESLQ